MEVIRPIRGSAFPRKDARKHFLERYWEMYLTVALIGSGFVPKRVGNTGPEFFIEVEARRFWVEAIALGPGTV